MSESINIKHFNWHFLCPPFPTTVKQSCFYFILNRQDVVVRAGAGGEEDGLHPGEGQGGPHL